MCMQVELDQIPAKALLSCEQYKAYYFQDPLVKEVQFPTLAFLMTHILLNIIPLFWNLIKLNFAEIALTNCSEMHLLGMKIALAQVCCLIKSLS